MFALLRLERGVLWERCTRDIVSAQLSNILSTIFLVPYTEYSRSTQKLYAQGASTVTNETL